MIRGKGLILALTVAFATACASGGGGGMEEPAGPGGYRPSDNSFTNSAGVHLAQAGLSEGEEATAHLEAALSDAMDAIREDSTNPKGYLIAGQAAIGLDQWIRADSMFAKARSTAVSCASGSASAAEKSLRLPSANRNVFRTLR